MKKFIAILTLLCAFAANAVELELHECKFGRNVIDFMPSPMLSAILNKELKGALVYKVKYKLGSNVVGPKTDLAVIDELPSKTLAVSFFEYDDQDGIVYSRNKIMIDLREPVKLDGPAILFTSELNDLTAPRGKCTLTL